MWPACAVPPQALCARSTLGAPGAIIAQGMRSAPTLLLLAAFSLAACARPAPPPAPAAAALPADRLVIRESLVDDVKPVDAVVATAHTTEARARIAGTLQRLLVTEDDVVRKGQLLAVVSDPRIGFQTSGYEAQAAAARAQLDAANANLARLQALYDRGFYPKAQLDQAVAAAKAAKGDLDAAIAQRAASAELAGQGAILAPESGRVIHAQIPAGSVVTAGQSVVTIASGDPVLRVQVPERDAGALKVGDAVDVVGPNGEALGPAGTIRKVYPAITAGEVAADIASPAAAGAPIGEKVTLAVKLGQRSAIIVPAKYVSTRFGLDYVRLLGAGGAADVPVQTAARAAGEPAEILSGLQPGDVIVPPGAG
jgi:RND family efflux transporter MFP subunit